MTMLNRQAGGKLNRHAHWSWLLPVLLLSPLALGAKGGCNAAVVGDDCGNDAQCAAGSAGKGGGTPNGKICGGLLGAQCDDGEFCSYAGDAMCGAADQTGVCKTRPEICNDIYAPVCGCDGKTYSNECEANGAGVSAARQGECGGNDPGPGGKACGGLQGLGCAAGEFCKYPPEAQCGAADQTGVCAPKPQICNDIYAPVCGCDEKTHSNECEANGAGVSVAYRGECGAAPKACGGRGGGTCAPDQYCLYSPAANCGRGDAPGVCANLPGDAACTTQYDPVCGCDGNTYGNACTATLAGMSIDYAGECGAPDGEICGGFLGTPCETGFFCDYPPDMACGFSDGSGVCRPVPEACDLVYSPVCGCDGMTYGNACAANNKGVSVASEGECQ